MSAVRGDVPVGADLAAMAVVVVMVAGVVQWPAVVATALVGWAMLNGFVVDQYGELRWHGAQDVVRLGLLLAVGLAAAAIREEQVRRRRADTGPRALVGRVVLTQAPRVREARLADLALGADAPAEASGSS